MLAAERLDIIEKRLAELEKQIQEQPKKLEEYLAKKINETIIDTLAKNWGGRNEQRWLSRYSI